MSKFIIECFDKVSELCDFVQDNEACPTFQFTAEYDGYLCLGSKTVRIKGKDCVVDVRGLEDGEYTPRLALRDRTIDLPKLRKQYGSLTPIDPSIEDIRKISLLERQLCQRVMALENEMREIARKVYGSILFELP